MDHLVRLFSAGTIKEKGLLRLYPYFEPQLRFYPPFSLLCIFAPTVPLRSFRLPLELTPLVALRV